MTDAEILDDDTASVPEHPVPLAHRPPAELFVTDDGVRLVETTEQSIGAWIEADEFVRLEAMR